MKITPKDTVKDIVLRNKALFSLGAKNIVGEISKLPEPSFVPLKRLFWPDRRLPIRNIEKITMGELNAIEMRKPSYEYFCTVLGVMLGMVNFKKVNANGSPDWNEGIIIDGDQIGCLRFIRAQRCFIAAQKGLEEIGKAWKKLEMPLTGDEAKAQVKRPNRGLSSICREYCQIMEGAVSMSEAWNTPWCVVYEAFEDRKYKNLTERRLHEAAMAKAKQRR